jgi:hypothetical protein
MIQYFAVVLRPPMFPDLLYESSTHQCFINDMDDVGGQDTPKAEAEEINGYHNSQMMQILCWGWPLQYTEAGGVSPAWANALLARAR